MNSYNKPVIAIYPQHYLTISMTFIHRQLIGVSDDFSPIVLASSVDHLDLFAHEPIFSKKANYIEKACCKLYRTSTGKYAFLSPRKTRYWKGLLKSHDTKLIHAHFGPSGLEMLPLAMDLNIPLIVTFHGYDASSLLGNTSYRSGLRGLFNYAHIVAVSRDMRGRLIAVGADPAKTTTHYIGVPLEDFKYIERIPISKKVKDGSRLEFLQVSNFVEKKGHEYTIQAFRDFLLKYPNSRLTLAGDGPLRDRIEVACTGSRISEKVRFTGQVTKKQVVSLMTEADVFLHHSVTAKNGDKEGIPTVIMEAMSTGLPIISTFHSGIPELIEDGINGYLIEERDVKGYTEKMLGLLDSKIALGRRASGTIAERFNMTNQNTKLKELYRKVMNG